ncbi:LPS export ABC transporter ATP-binding protein [Allorhodopirellula solitaria]|uniref:Lipopolysaccharide export system ATP-binding protein LptB n=1 Tax=Allorhodopirellula solitaria TaxID=2527987 RepID=A0A5C5YJG6_9BACT|nr:LPS export ABC transporter ATP-binding protein [Allorhodopirellula solitaria]TWT75020.1 Lipopolysaccharide export system ATP-binding protein LptB [Allorhodopirellula solitaria]
MSAGFDSATLPHSDHDEFVEREPILEAVGLQKTYGRRPVVDGVNLSVDEAEIVGLLGPNGAGKSTSFRMICGLVQPDRGRVYLAGQDVTDWPMFRRARDGNMGYLPQEPSVFKKLSVEQNISALLELLGFDRKRRKERTNELLEEFNITHIRKSPAAGLSGGERRRLEIARCLVSDPKIVMLDEPFAGIDPVTVQSIQGVITQLRDSGISVLITDHAAREILTTVDRCYVIYQGQVLIDGTPDEVKRHPKVREEYLGDLDAAAGTQNPPSDPGSFQRIDPAHESIRVKPAAPRHRPRRVTDV